VDSVLKSIHDSILSILDCEDATHSQYPTAYYLDPAAAKIRWYTKAELIDEDINEDWVQILIAHPRAIPRSIVDVLLRIKDILVEHCLEFQMLGKWKNKPDYSLLRLELNVVIFYRPEDWFDAFDLYDIRHRWKQGMSAEEIVSALFQEENIKRNLDRREVLTWIRQMFQKWQNQGRRGSRRKAVAK